MLQLINSALSSERVVGCNLSRGFTFSICFYTSKADLKFPRIKQSINLVVNLCTCRESRNVWGKLSTPWVFEVLFHLQESHRWILRDVSPPSKHKIYVWITLNIMQMISLKSAARGKDLCRGSSSSSSDARQERLQCGLHRGGGSQTWVLGANKGPKILPKLGASANYLMVLIIQLQNK